MKGTTYTVHLEVKAEQVDRNPPRPKSSGDPSWERVAQMVAELLQESPAPGWLIEARVDSAEEA